MVKSDATIPNIPMHKLTRLPGTDKSPMMDLQNAT